MKSSLRSLLILGLVLAGTAARAAESAAAMASAPAANPPATSPAPASPHPLQGKWTAEFDSQIGVQTYTYEFKVEGTTVTGTAEGGVAGVSNGKTEIIDGKVVGDEVTFTEKSSFGDTPLTITYKGKLKGDEIAFSRNVADIADEELVAKRAKPAAAPTAPAAAAAPAKK